MAESILIAGTGALATLFAHRLSTTGFEVTIAGTWKEGLAALKEAGAREDDSSGVPLRVMTDSIVREVDCALVLVKSWQTERVGRFLLKCLSDEGVAVSLQNGLGNDEILRQILGKERVGRGVTTMGATLIGPGHVHLGGEGKVVLEKGPKTAPLETRLRKAGFEVDMVDDIDRQIWGKLILNAAINPLTALLRVKNGSLLEIPSARRLMTEIGKEAADVANMKGVRLPFEDVEAALEEVARRSGDNTSSMLQDVLRGVPTEVDSINGKIVEEAEKQDFPAPINRLMVSLIKAMSERGKIKDVNIG